MSVPGYVIVIIFLVSEWRLLSAADTQNIIQILFGFLKFIQRETKEYFQKRKYILLSPRAEYELIYCTNIVYLNTSVLIHSFKYGK